VPRLFRGARRGGRRPCGGPTHQFRDRAANAAPARAGGFRATRTRAI